MISEDEQRNLLQYEEFVAELNKRRNPSSRKVWWESSAIISSVTAVVTVALSAIAGYSSQRLLRDNEVATKQAQETYQQEVAVLQAAHLLANEAVHYSYERSRLLDGEYDALDLKQKSTLTDSVNAADAKWRQGRQSSRVGLELEFGDNRAVMAAWDSVTSQINRYANCSVTRNPDRPCWELRPAAESALTDFRALAVQQIREHNKASGRR